MPSLREATSMTELWPWLALAGLGMFHGVNPAMGWLFAVALGLHRHSRQVVVLALVPIALGHALSIAVVLAAYAVAQLLNSKRVAAIVAWVGAALTLLWYFTSDEVPREFTGMAPYVITLLVLAFASQSLRMPAADGQIYRKGSAG